MLYLTEKYIIKPVVESAGIIEGFDLVSENYVRVLKSDCIPVGSAILALIKEERIRYFVARELADNKTEIGYLLGKSYRTTLRIASSHD